MIISLLFIKFYDIINIREFIYFIIPNFMFLKIHEYFLMKLKRLFKLIKIHISNNDKYIIMEMVIHEETKQKISF